ncbi:hypothetical protein IscW_ISCW001136, partial [Ixodes scapularis]
SSRSALFSSNACFSKDSANSFARLFSANALPPPPPPCSPEPCGRPPPPSSSG